MNECGKRHKMDISGTDRLCVGAVLNAVYRSFVSFRPLRNVAQLADGPTMYMRWLGEGICFLAFANPISILAYK